MVAPVLEELSKEYAGKINVYKIDTEQEQDLAAAYRLGVNAYVRKPLEFDEFIGTVRHLVVFWATLNLLPNTDPE